ncbi:MAG: hypothetical protein C0410_15610, partial [Anaerolinea sp.]|nr:hypothetical protein [Anaerolinea sp.]
MTDKVKIKSNFLLDKIKAIIQLSRIFTLVAPLIGGVFFSLMGYKEAYNTLPSLQGWSLIILVGIILAVSNFHSNVLNQIYDKDMDKLHPTKKNRPIPAERISPEEAYSLAIALLLLALLLSLSMFGITFAISITVIAIFSWLYNAPPFRLKKRLFWSNLGISVPRGGIGIVCAYSAFASPYIPVIYVAIVYFALYVFGTNTLKDFADEPYDRLSGVRNFVTVYGRSAASTIVMVFTVIPFAWLLAVQLFGYLTLNAIVFLPLLLSAGMVYLLTT